MKIIRKKEKVFERVLSKDRTKSFSLSAILIDHSMSRDFFIHHERVEPGARTSAPHRHEETDEFVYILKGRMIAIDGEEEMLLGEGDSVCFSSQEASLHYLENRSDDQAEVLVITRSLSNSDVIIQ